MAISKATIKAIGVSALLIFLYSLTLLLYLWSKYDSIGDCAAIVYYNPISFKDIIYMAFIGMFWYGVSLFLLKKTKKLYITEGAIYVLLLFAFSLGGNTILESRKMHWPTEYYPRPISSKDKIHILQFYPCLLPYRKHWGGRGEKVAVFAMVLLRKSLTLGCQPQPPYSLTCRRVRRPDLITTPRDLAL